MNRMMTSIDRNNNDIVRKDADVAVIGGGAAGCMAAAAAAESGMRTVIFEKNDSTGKKIRATGNGRCNLTNAALDAGLYYSDDPDLVARLIARFGPDGLLGFFREEGLYFYERDGYIYPRTDQAFTVTEALSRRLLKAGVRLETGSEISSVEKESDCFLITTAGRKIFRTSKLILCTGGMAGKGFGNSGDGYRFARHFGHTVFPPLPALVPLSVPADLVKPAAGCRCHAEISLLIDGKKAASETGQLQITAGTLSGIPVFQLSSLASRAVSEGREVSLTVDFIPEISEEALSADLKKRASEAEENTSCPPALSDFYRGFVPDGVLSAILSVYGLQKEKKVKNMALSGEVRRNLLMTVGKNLKAFQVPVTGPEGFEKAQVTTGGIPLRELNASSLESGLVSGLFFAGEILNVDGPCGGYNLQWAFTSGFLAGLEASGKAIL